MKNFLVFLFCLLFVTMIFVGCTDNQEVKQLAPTATENATPVLTATPEPSATPSSAPATMAPNNTPYRDPAKTPEPVTEYGVPVAKYWILNSVNVRSEPVFTGGTATRISTLEFGDSIYAMEVTDEYIMFHLAVKDWAVKAYIRNDPSTVSIESPYKPPVEKEGRVIRYVTTGSLNVRSSPVFSGSANLVGSMRRSVWFYVIEEGDGYYKIEWPDEECGYAYISNDPSFSSLKDPLDRW